MSEYSRRRSSSRRGRNAYTWINLGLSLLFTGLSGFALMTMYRYNIANVAFVNHILTLLSVLVIIGAVVLLFTKRARLITAIILAVGSLLAGTSLFAMQSAIKATSTMNKTASISEVKMSVLVTSDSQVSDVSGLTEVVAPSKADGANIQNLVSRIQSDKGTSLSVKDADSYQTAYDDLVSGKTQAMLMNSAYAELLALTYDDYESQVKEIYSYTVTQSVTSDGKAKAAVDADVFNIYISGIDTYGSISTVSRSDVNIIMTVNKKTNQILLTTTPRDSYVKIPNGGGDQYDKLTHAGLYGVETSMKTLEDLYGIDIAYYARINFTTFLELIDLVGGVEVYNDQAFTAHTDQEETFEVGNLTLDSKRALAFVRERYSLTNGDNDRGKNQEKVIAAIIKKLTSVNSITNYTKIIEGLSSSIQTDMELATMMDLANAQLASGAEYAVTSQALIGTGSTGQLKSYAMPNASLYMMSIDENSLAEVKANITKTMEGN